MIHFGESDFLTATLKQVPPQWQEHKLNQGSLTVKWLDIGVLVFESPDRIPRNIVLSAGIHGNETAPIEILNQLVTDILANQLLLSPDVRLMIIFGNPEAMQKAVRYVNDDMNRLFGKCINVNSLEFDRCQLIKKLLNQFFEKSGPLRFHYDMHTAIRGSMYEKFAVYPYLGPDRDWNMQQMTWLSQKCAIQTFLLSNEPSGTFSYYTSNEFNCHSFTLELGKVMPFGQNDLSKFSEIDTSIRNLVTSGTFEECDVDLLRQVPVFRVKYELVKQSEAFTLNLPDHVLNFSVIPDQSIIAQDKVSDMTVQHIGQGGTERILFPNPKVKVGLRAGIIVEPTCLFQ